MALAPFKAPGADDWKDAGNNGGLLMGMGRRMSGGFKGGLGGSGRVRRTAADVNDVYDGGLTAKRAARKTMEASDKSDNAMPVFDDVPFPAACVAVSESLCLAVGQLLSPGVTILPHPPRHVSDWLPFVLDELKPLVNDGVTVCAPFAFVRMSDPTVGLERTLGDTRILQNSDTIVNLAYRDEAFELTAYERGKLALRVCDVIKVVALPSKVPRLREILRLDALADKEKARQAMDIPKGVTLTASGKIPVEGVVNPFLQLMGGNKTYGSTAANVHAHALDKHRDGENGFAIAAGTVGDDGRVGKGHRRAKHSKTMHQHQHQHPSPQRAVRNRRDAQGDDGAVPAAAAGSSPLKHKDQGQGHSIQSTPRAASPDTSVSAHTLNNRPPARSRSPSHSPHPSLHTSPVHASPPHLPGDPQLPHLPKLFPPTNTTKIDRAIIALLMRSTSAALDKPPPPSQPSSSSNTAAHSGALRRGKPPQRRYSFGGLSAVHCAADAARILVNASIAMTGSGTAITGSGTAITGGSTDGGEMSGGGEDSGSGGAGVSAVPIINSGDPLLSVNNTSVQGVEEDSRHDPSLLLPPVDASIAANRADTEFVSLVNNLPMAESLIISLAAAERTIANLEKENNQYRYHMGEIIKEKDNHEIHINVLNTKIARLVTEKDALKKAAKELKYAHVLEGKQVDLRMKEFDQVKVQYEQYQKKTEPLIATLTAKVKTMEILAAAEQSELERAIAVAVKTATDDLILKEARVVAAAREAVTMLPPTPPHPPLPTHTSPPPPPHPHLPTHPPPSLPTPLPPLLLTTPPIPYCTSYPLAPPSYPLVTLISRIYPRPLI